MWIHLLSLGLIDGAGGAVPFVPLFDMHDGGHNRKWKKELPELQEVLAFVQENPEQAVRVAKKETNIPQQYLDITKISDNLNAQIELAKMMVREIEARQQEKRQRRSIELLLLI